MYQPTHFRQSDESRIHDLIRNFPLAALVISGENGPDADHLPLHLEIVVGGRIILHGHVARANPLWKRTESHGQVLVNFQGPDAYVSPAWYPGKQEHGRVVPTWNYAVVHAYGSLECS